ncbi:MAG: hypothetical protein ACUVTW_04665, partial [Thermogutta sp.]
MKLFASSAIARWGLWLSCWVCTTMVVWAGGTSKKGYAAEAGSRSEISLDGDWQIAESADETPPTEFAARVSVPGLADMAEPAFAEVGTEKSREHRRFFWYRRTFRVNGKPPV